MLLEAEAAGDRPLYRGDPEWLGAGYSAVRGCVSGGIGCAGGMVSWLLCGMADMVGLLLWGWALAYA